MKYLFLFLFFFTATNYPKTAYADLFGGDVAVLSQILVNAYQQLSQLQSILGTGKDNLGLLKDLNKGINDSLTLMRTVSPDSQPGIYSNWRSSGQAQDGLQNIYGAPIHSREKRIQQDTDQSVAEAISLNNSIYQYSSKIDEIGENIKSFSHVTSPGGAQKLTAETLGVMLHVLNQTLRTQATGLKLQAQALELQNHKDKENSRQLAADSSHLAVAMKSDSLKFSIPRF